MQTTIKEIAEKYANSVWNDKSMDAIETDIHPDAVIHSPLGAFQGPEAMKTIVQAWLTGFPDLCVDNEIVIAEKDLVSIQWRAAGTHAGEFKGKRPTGKKSFLFRHHGLSCSSKQNR